MYDGVPPDIVAVAVPLLVPQEAGVDERAGIGGGDTTTVAVAVAVQLPTPAVTEYVVVMVGETKIAELVLPVFQE